MRKTEVIKKSNVGKGGSGIRRKRLQDYIKQEDGASEVDQAGEATQPDQSEKLATQEGREVRFLFRGNSG